MPIRVLPPRVAAKIAAGEVVERPASGAKELIENAIDAGATDIQIEIRRGGRRLIRVSDNGCGIPRDQAKLAFARHATSKISSEEDLLRVMTLGFRGEALASIAAVSQVAMLTRVEGETTGILLRLEGGEIVRSDKRGGTPGTVVTVENLFYNTPARLKFLRSELTEAKHVVKLLNAYAMAYPELRFRLTVDGRLSLQTSGSGRLYDVLIKVFGLEMTQQMLEIGSDDRTLAADAEQEDSVPASHSSEIRVRGYVGAPSLHRATRDYQFLFVNGRWIKDRSLSYAVREAYRTLLPTGRHPVTVVHIALDPTDVDVNVHPTKRELRFRDPRGVFAAVQRAVRRTIIGQAPVAAMTSQPSAVRAGDWERGPHFRQQVRLDRAQMALEMQRPVDTGMLTTTGAPMREQLPMLRVLGQIKQMYLIAEGPEGLYLIDQHAAHERIIFEQLQAEQTAMAVSSQSLLEPLPVELAPGQQGLLAELLEHLMSFGFDIAPFGGNSLLVRAVPAALAPAHIRSMIAELLDAAGEGKKVPVSLEHTLTVIACHSAVRAGQTLTTDEARELVRQLEKTSAPYTCPHGRPTMIHLSSAQLEHSFGRR